MVYLCICTCLIQFTHEKESDQIIDQLCSAVDRSDRIISDLQCIRLKFAPLVGIDAYLDGFNFRAYTVIRMVNLVSYASL